MKKNPGSRILFVVAHPRLRDSRSNRIITETVADLPGVTVHRLYDLYPYFHVDVKAEQKLLEAHDLIVVQHPFYWYSMPALMRQWLVDVFQPGWAYGAGDKLKDKGFMASITVGGPPESFAKDGYNRFPMDTYLAPWNQTAYLCRMKWCEPCVLYNSIGADEERLREHGRALRARLATWMENA